MAGQPGLLGPPAARTVFTTGRWQTAYKLIPLQNNSPNTLPFPASDIQYYSSRLANSVAYCEKTAYLTSMAYLSAIKVSGI